MKFCFVCIILFIIYFMFLFSSLLGLYNMWTYFSLLFFFDNKFTDIDVWELHQDLPLEGSREAYNPQHAVYLIA